jgi:hypothetical protein
MKALLEAEALSATWFTAVCFEVVLKRENDEKLSMGKPLCRC